MKYKVTLNNRVYEVEVEQGEAMLIDEYELKAPAAAAPAAAPAPVAAAPAAPAAPAPAPAAGLAAGEVVKSPMPGNVLKINVQQGQKVNEGDVLIVLEAMKMENDINSPKAGVVKALYVNKGDTVASGQVLFEVE